LIWLPVNRAADDLLWDSENPSVDCTSVSWLSIALLACAVLAVIGAEWPRLARNFGFEARRRRERDRRKAQLKLLRTDDEELDESDEFAASVQRDLSQLPTIDERDRR
jgi:hypothetical protein